MSSRIRSLGLVCFVLLVSVAFTDAAWGLGFELSQSKEELGLHYEVTATVHDSGRVTITIAITDHGKLQPLESIWLAVPSDDGSGYFDLSMQMSVSEHDGRWTARTHLSRDLADRAAIQLRTRTNPVDGTQSPRSWYYHAIRVAGHLSK